MRLFHLSRLSAAAAITLLATLPAQAADTFHLRSLSQEANWTTNPDDATLRFHDRFNDGLLQSGADFDFSEGALSVTVPGAGTDAGNPLYGLQGSAPAVSLSNALTVDGQTFGRATFTPSGGTAPSLLNIGGQDFLDSAQRMTLRTPGGGLLTRARNNFAISSAWDFAIPDIGGMRYGMRLSDGGIATDGSFNDLISMDVFRQADGSMAAQMRRVSGAGTSRTITEQETIALSSGLFAGRSLAEVELVSLHMYWSETSGVFGDLEMLSITDSGAVDGVGLVSFNTHYPIFHGELFTRLQVGASWTVPAAPVPEPGSWALMAAGLAGLAWRARQRRG